MAKRTAASGAIGTAQERSHNPPQLARLVMGGVSPLMSRPVGSFMQFAGSRLGGYTAPYNMAGTTQQGAQPHAHDGSVDDSALAHAHALSHEAKRGCGGQVSYKSGGEVLSTEPIRIPQTVRGAKEIVALWDKIERENPNVSADRQFSYLRAKSPEVRRIFKAMLADSYSRSGARATIGGGMRALAAEEDE
jgi:hypothetical protein